ncbi:hypothetical protein B1207_10290 [Legionella quinlivanii]|uniref:Lipocalin-like domain-containing protein n=1 Tax=Legionella quinlivanii TaxID=45073 RepID=A0A364LI26_9GAMM|nr:hypothetical protein [Legionella quinlivanii]RAP35958.1 hypothetical protein B1207_10290 [Legionella quinlivanii]
MKTLLATFSLLAFTSFAGQASQSPYDYCNKLPGKWHAATHIKDHSSCDPFNGCEHFDLVTFQQTSKDDYTATLYFSNDGNNITVQSFSFICAANEFHFKNQEDKTVHLKCDEYNNCYMVVDTPLFTVELVKQ